MVVGPKSDALCKARLWVKIVTVKHHQAELSRLKHGWDRLRCRLGRFKEATIVGERERGCLIVSEIPLNVERKHLPLRRR
ncbi:hypothetical protein B0O99DRAFT_48451 [Bisporella sp. PMI_857]|nr:hypothetical protein B0O99DRAFT_48451 [Bisporella sp. PMI_857]